MTTSTPTGLYFPININVFSDLLKLLSGSLMVYSLHICDLVVQVNINRSMFSLCHTRRERHSIKLHQTNIMVNKLQAVIKLCHLKS